MKEGDVIQIDGRLGFLMNPKMRVVEVKGQMVLLEKDDAQTGGLLSHTNQSWHSIDIIESKLDRD